MRDSGVHFSDIVKYLRANLSLGLKTFRMSTGQAIRAEVQCRIRGFASLAFTISKMKNNMAHSEAKRFHLKDSQSQELFEFHLRLFTLMQVVVATRGFLSNCESQARGPEVRILRSIFGGAEPSTGDASQPI